MLSCAQNFEDFLIMRTQIGAQNIIDAFLRHGLRACIGRLGGAEIGRFFIGHQDRGSANPGRQIVSS